MAKVPDTISDRDWQKLQDRAHKANGDIFSADATRRRKQSSGQLRKANQS